MFLFMFENIIPMKEARWSAFLKRTISSSSTIRVATAVTPIQEQKSGDISAFQKVSYVKSQGCHVSNAKASYADG